jgi:molecular chaperone GrpE
VAAVLAEFEGWLCAVSAPSPDVPTVFGSSPSVDLHTLVSQFVALRHEVNLQTRAARAQQEQNTETLRQLGLALDALRQSQAAGQRGQQEAQEERLRPLLKTLVDLHDALAVAGREMGRVQDTVLPLLEQVLEATEVVEEPAEEPAEEVIEEPAEVFSEEPSHLASLPSSPPPRPFWSRWFGTPSPEAVDARVEAIREAQRQQEARERRAQARQERARREQAQRERIRQERARREQDRRERARLAREAVERVRQVLTSLLTGYTMSLQRLERALRQHGLEPIEAVGVPFDPERMEAVEAVRDSGRPSGEVLEEVRRGYLWNGRVFRYAQVRVAFQP